MAKYFNAYIELYDEKNNEWILLNTLCLGKGSTLFEYLQFLKHNKLIDGAPKDISKGTKFWFQYEQDSLLETFLITPKDAINYFKYTFTPNSEEVAGTSFLQEISNMLDLISNPDNKIRCILTYG